MAHARDRREVLLSVSYAWQSDVVGRRIAVDLTVQEVSDSLAAELRPPVSQPSVHGSVDPHLRSVDAVIGHRVVWIKNSGARRQLDA
jgi:hypothetical protein